MGAANSDWAPHVFELKVEKKFYSEQKKAWRHLRFFVFFIVQSDKLRHTSSITVTTNVYGVGTCVDSLWKPGAEFYLSDRPLVSTIS